MVSRPLVVLVADALGFSLERAARLAGDSELAFDMADDLQYERVDLN